MTECVIQGTIVIKIEDTFEGRVDIENIPSQYYKAKIYPNFLKIKNITVFNGNDSINLCNLHIETITGNLLPEYKDGKMVIYEHQNFPKGNSDI